ncbi:hypothetical protein DPMN_177352 [Dreissena polymorpha]|uniref:Uncharacterized protein n=1 Tax=Dreissena polymorpha TaxID=45954 RepID=A0A9D4EA66_DREPO|nr:hypothetical protein DPMN_177352 [Dreissena polymorpha]
MSGPEQVPYSVMSRLGPATYSVMSGQEPATLSVMSGLEPVTYRVMSDIDQNLDRRPQVSHGDTDRQ